MIIVPIQAFGLGDCIFEQTIVRKIANGNPIEWPVEPQFLEGLQRAYPDITWLDKNTAGIDLERREDYVKDGRRYLPLRWCDTNYKAPYARCMALKYEYYGHDFHTWKQMARWSRNMRRELTLKHYIGAIDEPYALVNRYFGSSSQLRAYIPPVSGLKEIEMRTLLGYSLFDWARVIEGATEIHTVSSSIFYLLIQSSA